MHNENLLGAETEQIISSTQWQLLTGIPSNQKRPSWVCVENGLKPFHWTLQQWRLLMVGEGLESRVDLLIDFLEIEDGWKFRGVLFSGIQGQTIREYDSLVCREIESWDMAAFNACNNEWRRKWLHWYCNTINTWTLLIQPHHFQKPIKPSTLS